MAPGSAAFDGVRPTNFHHRPIQGGGSSSSTRATSKPGARKRSSTSTSRRGAASSAGPSGSPTSPPLPPGQAPLFPGPAALQSPPLDMFGPASGAHNLPPMFSGAPMQGVQVHGHAPGDSTPQTFDILNPQLDLSQFRSRPGSSSGATNFSDLYVGRPLLSTGSRRARAKADAESTFAGSTRSSRRPRRPAHLRSALPAQAATRSSLAPAGRARSTCRARTARRRRRRARTLCRPSRDRRLRRRRARSTRRQPSSACLSERTSATTGASLARRRAPRVESGTLTSSPSAVRRFNYSYNAFASNGSDQGGTPEAQGGAAGAGPGAAGGGGGAAGGEAVAGGSSLASLLHSSPQPPTM